MGWKMGPEGYDLSGRVAIVTGVTLPVNGGPNL